ncbi:peptidase M15A [Almyronema epifaneia]|uniref:Peptidase M15A n=1 Tax=Almyronema epifaneia S1 TaxID=2991925 RepID=A0ABW6IK06_9CYAN
MAKLSDPQRNDYYLIEAARVGIHKPILGALYQVHQSPQLAEGETGLGVAPANRIAVDQVSTFAQQVRYAANTIRSLTDSLTAQGWSSRDLWNIPQGRYSDRLIQTLAEGYAPASSDWQAARLEATDPERLLTTYQSLATQDLKPLTPDQSLSQLENALIAFVTPLPTRYSRLGFERHALLEMVRTWRKLDDPEAAIAALNVPTQAGVPDILSLDTALIQFLQQVPKLYSGYPHQREALLRLAQLWHQLGSRTATINQMLTTQLGSLPSPQLIDPALIAFVQKVPDRYQGQGDYRLALTEAFRLWHQLASRTAALEKLGVSADYLKLNAEDTQALTQAAIQVDQGLRQFIQQVPQQYQANEVQREALLQLVQHWRKLENRPSTLQSILDDLRYLEASHRAAESAPPPVPALPSPRPDRWQVNNLQLAAPILPNGSFTWAEATQGGLHLPINQAAIESIVRLAHLLQPARDRIGHPFQVVQWYDPTDRPPLAPAIINERRAIGDALVFYCEGLTSRQVYWALAPWWPGGLGRYSEFPALVQLDARRYRARWQV